MRGHLLLQRVGFSPLNLGKGEGVRIKGKRKKKLLMKMMLMRFAEDEV